MTWDLPVCAGADCIRCTFWIARHENNLTVVFTNSCLDQAGDIGSSLLPRVPYDNGVLKSAAIIVLLKGLAQVW